MIEFTEEEKSYLISHLQGEWTWNSNMAKQYSKPFDERTEILTSILSKLGQHPFKTKLEQNSKHSTF